jgi:hypothetical protein
MPMYGGMLTENTMHGLLQLQQWSMAKGVGLRLQSMGNESLITRARNTIVSMMMDLMTMSLLIYYLLIRILDLKLKI